jgi:RNA polymerase sigma factor (sigma-70 family)
MATRPTPEQARRLLDEAKQAAAAGKPDSMLEALSQSGFLDGLAHRLRKEWPRLPTFELQECIGRAVDVAYSFVAQGGVVRDLGAWLWKTARNLAGAKWRDEYETRGSAEEAESAASPEPETEAERIAAEELDDHRRSEAIRLARELIPRIGEGQVRQVMEMLIEAAATGTPDLPPAQIADALGLSEDAVRTLLSRGLKRLRREAARAGVTFPDELPEISTDTESED